MKLVYAGEMQQVKVALKSGWRKVARGQVFEVLPGEGAALIATGLYTEYVERKQEVKAPAPANKAGKPAAGGKGRK